MAKSRKKFSAKEKVLILKKHLVDKIPVSDLCDEYGCKPASFYQWQKLFFERGAEMFSAQDRDSRKARLDERQKILDLEEKIQQKNEVVSELAEANLQLKKSLGES